MPEAPKTQLREWTARPAVAVDVVLFTLADELEATTSLPDRPGASTSLPGRPEASTSLPGRPERRRPLQVLLTRRYEQPYAEHWCLPGDWVRPEERLEQVALRELAGAGVEDMYLEQLYTFDRPDRDPRHRVISVAFFALLRADAAIRHALNDGADARWWSLDQLPQPLAFDHHDILRAAVDRLRSKLEYTTLAFMLLPEVFTLPELKQTYETILGEELDRGNFYRKIKEAGLLEPTGRRRESGGRPAALYCFRADRGEGDFVFRWREARSARRDRANNP